MRRLLKFIERAVFQADADALVFLEDDPVQYGSGRYRLKVRVGFIIRTHFFLRFAWGLLHVDDIFAVGKVLDFFQFGEGLAGIERVPCEADRFF